MKTLKTLSHLHGYIVRKKVTKYYFYEFTRPDGKYRIYGLKTNVFDEAIKRAEEIDKKIFGGPKEVDNTLDQSIQVINKKQILLFSNITHEDISSLVEAYNKVLDTTDLCDEDAIMEAARVANIEAHIFILKKALFGHKYIKDFEDIPTPYYRANKHSTNDSDRIRRIRRIKQLADEGKTREEIIEITNEFEDFINGILDGILYTDIANSNKEN